jgi:hypothetical protein
VVFPIDVRLRLRRSHDDVDRRVSLALPPAPRPAEAVHVC